MTTQNDGNTKYVCEQNTCNGCYACSETCQSGAIKVCDGVRYFNAEIDTKKCVNCGRCFAVCPNNGSPDFKEPVFWRQGWAENSVRKNSASGGFAYKISENFIKSGGIVCACAFENGEFEFKIYSTTQNLYEIQGSKYVKSNPQKIYRPVKELLRQNKKVLFIGLPCQVSAAKSYVGKKYGENLYTIDLICHGTPSKKILERFLNEKNTDLKTANAISFRNKTRFGIGINGKSLDRFGIPDRYTVAFSQGLCYTENCYRCKFAKRQRVSDITLGDSWGSEIADESEGGISLLLCMTEKGRILTEPIKNLLKPVDVDKALKSNRQLNCPTKKPECYSKFFEMLKNGKTVSAAVFKSCPEICLKQNIKRILVRLNIIKTK